MPCWLAHAFALHEGGAWALVLEDTPPHAATTSDAPSAAKIWRRRRRSCRARRSNPIAVVYAKRRETVERVKDASEQQRLPPTPSSVVQ